MADNFGMWEALTYLRMKLRSTEQATIHTLHTIVDPTPPSGLQRYDNGDAFAPQQEHQVSVAAGVALRIYGFKTTSGTEFLQVYDVAGAAAGVPFMQLAVPELSSFSIDFGAAGRALAAGLTVALSSASGALVAGSAGLWLNAEFT